MALPPVYMKITTVLSSLQKNNFYNVHYFKPVGIPTWTDDPTADCQTIGAAIYGVLIANLDLLLTQNTEIVGASFVLHKNGQSYDTSIVTGTFGTREVDESPDFVAAVIQKRTATPGRSGRGRWFLGPVAEDLTDENRILPAYREAFENVAHDWGTTHPALGTDWDPQLYSPKTASMVGITSVYVDWKLGELSHRKSVSVLT